jgi:Autographiviridae endonuclease VII
MSSQAQKNWYHKHKERLLENQRLYRKTNKEYIRKKNQESYQSSREEYLKKCRDYYRSTGKDVKRNYRMVNMYGITLDEYNKMFESQNGCCAICKTHQSFLNKKLAVDHNHAIGNVRGLLCDKCNKALGMVNDNIEILKRMMKYLEGE